MRERLCKSMLIMAVIFAAVGFFCAALLPPTAYAPTIGLFIAAFLLVIAAALVMAYG
jgi:4-hydroxybenzoate polyprenyltransferase